MTDSALPSAAGFCRHSWPASARMPAAALRTRVASEITTTFAISDGMELSLRDAVDPAMVKRYGAMAAGDKALIKP